MDHERKPPTSPSTPPRNQQQEKEAPPAPKRNSTAGIRSGLGTAASSSPSNPGQSHEPTITNDGVSKNLLGEFDKVKKRGIKNKRKEKSEQPTETETKSKVLKMR